MHIIIPVCAVSAVAVVTYFEAMLLLKRWGVLRHPLLEGALTAGSLVLVYVIGNITIFGASGEAAAFYVVLTPIMLIIACGTGLLVGLFYKSAGRGIFSKPTE